MSELTAGDRARLETIAADRNTPRKHAWRTLIVRLSADNEIRREMGNGQWYLYPSLAG